jgi:hypothetical protein
VRLSAVVLARALAFVETVDLNPRGKMFYPEMITEFVQRYQFQKFPKTFEDVDETKGVEFWEGKVENIVIQKFTIFNTLLVCTGLMSVSTPNREPTQFDTGRMSVISRLRQTFRYSRHHPWRI